MSEAPSKPPKRCRKITTNTTTSSIEDEMGMIRELRQHVLCVPACPLANIGAINLLLAHVANAVRWSRVNFPALEDMRTFDYETVHNATNGVLSVATVAEDDTRTIHALRPLAECIRNARQPHVDDVKQIQTILGINHQTLEKMLTKSFRCGWTLLLSALNAEKEQLAIDLMKVSPQANDIGTIRGQTPLTSASLRGLRTAVAWLLAHGAHPNHCMLAECCVDHRDLYARAEHSNCKLSKPESLTMVSPIWLCLTGHSSDQAKRDIYIQLADAGGIVCPPLTSSQMVRCSGVIFMA